jgi:hypothetical protein
LPLRLLNIHVLRCITYVGLSLTDWQAAAAAAVCGHHPLQFAGLGGAGQSECELTELKAMLGVVGEQRYVAGFLTQVRCGEAAGFARGTTADLAAVSEVVAIPAAADHHPL